MRRGEPRKLPPRELTIVHSIDFDEYFAQGGVETWTSDFLDFSKIMCTVLTSHAAKNQESTTLVAPFSLLHKLSRAVIKHLPEGFSLLLHMVKHRRLFTSSILVHRFELVPFLFLLKGSSNVNLVIHTDIRLQESFDNGKRWQLSGAVSRFLEFLSLKLADRILCYSPTYYYRSLESNPRALLCPAWYNDKIFSGSTYTTRPRTVVWAGRYEPVKDPLLAIEAFSLLPERLGASMVMFGRGALEARMKRLVSELNLGDRISIRPAIPPVELAEFLAKSKCLLLTSVFEGAPRIMVEALAQGASVVTVATADTEGLGKSNPNVFVSASRNVPEVATRLMAALSRNYESFPSVHERMASRQVPRLDALIL